MNMKTETYPNRQRAYSEHTQTLAEYTRVSILIHTKFDDITLRC